MWRHGQVVHLKTCSSDVHGDEADVSSPEKYSSGFYNDLFFFDYN